MESEQYDGIPVYGPAVAVLPSGKWSTLYPLRKTTYEKFGEEAAKTVATVALYDMIPLGWRVVESVPLEFTIAEQYITRPPGGEMVLVRVIAQLTYKEE
jgi:hypothetical protein